MRRKKDKENFLKIAKNTVQFDHSTKEKPKYKFTVLKSCLLHLYDVHYHAAYLRNIPAMQNKIKHNINTDD